MPSLIRRSWFVRGMAKAASDMSRRGWGRQHTQSVSLRLFYDDIESYEDQLVAGGKQSIGDRISGIGGQYYLVTVPGRSFHELPQDLEESLTILRMSPDGDSYKPLWGVRENGILASDLSVHMRVQDLRQRITLGANHVVIQSSPANLTALASLMELSPAMITRALWEMSSECLRVCPDGIGVLQGVAREATAVGMPAANAMRKHRLAIWPFQGIFAAEKTLEEAFELVDVAEAAAEILVRVLNNGGPKQFVENRALQTLAERHQVKPFAPAMELETWFTPPANGKDS